MAQFALHLIAFAVGLFRFVGEVAFPNSTTGAESLENGHIFMMPYLLLGNLELEAVEVCQGSSDSSALQGLCPASFLPLGQHFCFFKTLANNSCSGSWWERNLQVGERKVVKVQSLSAHSGKRAINKSLKIEEKYQKKVRTLQLSRQTRNTNSRPTARAYPALVDEIDHDAQLALKRAAVDQGHAPNLSKSRVHLMKTDNGTKVKKKLLFDPGRRANTLTILRKRRERKSKWPSNNLCACAKSTPWKPLVA